MATNDALALAYDAGRAAFAEPPERRSVSACPFSPLDHPEQREAWLDGFESAMNDQVDLAADLKKARNAA
jgi:ribosome modulation factor